MIRIKIAFWICILMAGVSTGNAQFTEITDSGWVSLFNGQDFDGWYVVTSSTLRDPNSQSSFSVTNGEIRTSGGGGYVATKGVYKNFQFRAQYKFDATNNGRNAGLLYHIPAADYKEGDTFGSRPPVNRLGTWPTCIEFQMYNGGGPSATQGSGPHAGAFLGINNVWAKSTVNRAMSCAYDPAGEDYDVVVGGLYCTRRVGPAVRGALDDNTKWVSLQLDSFGDSSVHYIDDELSVRVWNIEYNDQSSPTRGPMTEGHLGFQSEGAAIAYRNFYIRMLDSLGNPIIPGCTNDKAPNFKPFATVDDSSCEAVAVKFKPDGKLEAKITTYKNLLMINYSQMRDLPKIKIELLNVLGENIKTISGLLQNGRIEVDLSTLPYGLILVKVTSENMLISLNRIINVMSLVF